jgi:hypothetical protein
VLSVPFGLFWFASQLRWLANQHRAIGHGPFRHGYCIGLFRHGWGEAIAVDQHQSGLTELPALLWCESKLVGVVSWLEQASHLQVGTGQAFGDVTEHPIGSDHGGRLR